MIFLSLLFIFIALLILITKPNLLFVLFSLEIIFVSINLNFIYASLLLDDFFGQIIALILFTLAAVDTSVGLVLILGYYNIRNIHSNLHNKLKLKAL